MPDEDDIIRYRRRGRPRQKMAGNGRARDILDQGSKGHEKMEDGRQPSPRPLKPVGQTHNIAS